MTTTASWLETKDFADLAFVLVFEGADLVCTTASKTVDETAAAGSIAAIYTAGTDWTTFLRGLEIVGEVGQEVELFDPRINPSSMEFILHDYDDTFIGLALRESNSAAKTTWFTANADSDDASFSVNDTAQFGATGHIYVGVTEAAVYGTTTVTTFGSLTRGKWALFGRASDATHFGRPHRLDVQNSNFAPAVSSVPQTFIGRRAALYVHHWENGVWSALADRQLLWAGQIDSLLDLGDGRFRLACTSVLEMLQTTLLANKYHGTLAEGVYLKTEDVGIDAGQLDHTTTPTTLHDATLANLQNPDGSSSSLASATWRHAEIASSINRRLGSWDQSSPLRGNWGVALVGEGESARYQFTVEHTPSTGTWAAWIWLSPAVLLALGFGPSQFSTSIYVSSYKLASLEFMQIDTTHWTATANLPPLMAQVKSGASWPLLTVQNVKGTFAVQPSTPDGTPTATQGFLKVGPLGIAAVQSAGSDQFYVTGDATKLFLPLGATPGLVGETLGPDGSAPPEWGWFEFRGFEPIPVEQIWLETGELGDIMARLLVSTGTSGYNKAADGVASYDNLPVDVCVGIPWALVDTDSVRDFGTRGNTPYVLLLTEPTPFLKLFESALAYCGCYCVWRNGKISVRVYGSEQPAGVAEATFTENNKAQHVTAAQAREWRLEPMRTTAERTRAAVFNRITFAYNRTIDGKFKSQVTIQNLPSITNFGLAKSIKIEAWGIYDGVLPFANAGITAIRDQAEQMIKYFGHPLVILERSYDFNLETQFTPGDRVAITDNAIVNPRTGTRGVTSHPCWVLSKLFDWKTGVGKVRLVFLPELVGRIGLWGPSARVDETADAGGFTDGYGVIASEKTYRCKAHEYSHSSQAADAARFVAGDKIRVLELSPASSSSFQAWADTVISQTGNDIVVTTGTTSLTAGKFYVIEHDDASTVTATQLAGFTFIADDADDSTGKAANDFYAWVGPSDQVTSLWIEAVDATTLYRKPHNTDDDKGEPLSVHLHHDAARTANTVNVWPITYVNDIIPTGDRPTVTSGSATLVYGPIPIPVFDLARALEIQCYGKISAAGTATMVVRASNGPATGTTTDLAWPDTGATSVTLTTTSTTGDWTGTANLTIGAMDMGAAPPRLWITVELSASGSLTATFGGLRISGVPI